MVGTDGNGRRGASLDGNDPTEGASLWTAPTTMTGVAMAVLVLLAFELGTAGLGWLLQHAGESVDHPSSTSGLRRASACSLWPCFLVGTAGPTMALHAANDPPKPPTVYQYLYK